ncbi:DNA-protecting protein DprA [Thermoleophilia bacterium SCSIO 60948]|nr:DNA-protecting protein DprA [Thermoleophilia bacterium SCSIO 60948]
MSGAVARAGGTAVPPGDPARWRLEVRDADYPASLAELAERPDVAGPPPATIWGVGDRRLLTELEPTFAVTIVGSRRPSAYGLEVAEDLGSELAAAGLTVISGMAMGIDAAAHRGALAAQGASIAVLAGGPDDPYPPSQRGLHADLLAAGAAIGERPHGEEPPGPWAFRERNRIMAALSDATIVVEAAERSGSLITARIATELGRRVCCVPGRIGATLAAGPNGLIRDGAELIRGAEDFLDGAIGVGARRARMPARDLEPELERLLEVIEGGASTPDAIAAEGPGPAAEIAVALVRLEILGLVRCDSQGRYETSTHTRRRP